ncbi:MAG: protein-L-isoaspartate O-methyltransferase family protein [Egibacteraceae bacterium]
MSIRMVLDGTQTRPPLTDRIVGLAAFATAIALLRCAPFRISLGAARAAKRFARRPADQAEAERALAARAWAAKFFPGRAACLEGSLAAFLADTAIEDAVARAAAFVSRQHYTDHRALGSVPQVTAQFAIERDLRRAGIQPGMRVLEIGTGTGYTGAVLAELAGPDGHVVSVDVDPALIQRAAKLHAERRVWNLTLVTADGHRGAREHAPFDAILAWATPTHIPQAWIEQARPGAVISTPIYIAPVARTVGHIRVTVAEEGHLAHPRLGGAVYVDMGPEINRSLGVPIFYIDARRDAEDGEVAWISTAWRVHSDGHDPTATLDILQSSAHREVVPLGKTEEGRALAWRDFRSYCAGCDASRHRPCSLTAYGTVGRTWISGIGFSTGHNAAVLTSEGYFIADTPDSPPLMKLRLLFRDWEQRGRPGIDALAPVLEPTSEGWQVRATLAHAAG